MEVRPRQSKAGIIKKQLLLEMSEQRIAIGARLPSESELMKQFAVSRTTVRQAITELSSEGFVTKKQGKGTFRISPTERRQPTEPSMLVGVWFNWPSGPLYEPMAQGIRDELAQWDYHAVFEGGMEAGAERRGVDSLVRKALDGFIVSPSSDPEEPHEPVSRVLDRKLPLVLVDKRIPGCPADLVCTNGQIGAECLVSHLIELGHRRIGFVGTAGVSTVEDRLHGYRLTMYRHGLPVDPSWIEVDEEVYRDYGRNAARRMLARAAASRPTAVFGANDPIGETIAEVARKQGMEVPRDLSVVGFDDAGFDSRQPAWMTTYAQPKYRIGQHAAQLLVRRIQDPRRHTETVLLEGKFVRRGSTARPPPP